MHSPTEPMMLGSPVGNPGHMSPLATHQTPHGNQFLPGYLMGDAATTPILNRSKAMVGPASTYSTPLGGGMVPRTSPKNVRSPKQPYPACTPVSSKEKAGAPPTLTLLDDFPPDAGSGVTDLLSRTSAFHDASALSHQSPRRAPPSVQTPQRAKTPPSPGQADPFYTQGELITPSTHLDSSWVTVFGFPSSSASFVMQRFAQYGNVVAHRVASDGGNWVHIRYESALQAKKALSRNGKVLPGNIMIGVVPCIDVKVMSEGHNISYRSPAVDVSLSGTPVRSFKAGSIRPLTAAYSAASSDNKVACDVRTPQKSSGVLTKAMDYIFG